MTEEQSKMLEESLEKLNRIDDYFFSTAIDGTPSRAARLDKILKAMDAGKLGGRVILWVAGAITVLSSAWFALKGFGR